MSTGDPFCSIHGWNPCMCDAATRQPKGQQSTYELPIMTKEQWKALRDSLWQIMDTLSIMMCEGCAKEDCADGGLPGPPNDGLDVLIRDPGDTDEEFKWGQLNKLYQALGDVIAYAGMWGKPITLSIKTKEINPLGQEEAVDIWTTVEEGLTNE